MIRQLRRALFLLLIAALSVASRPTYAEKKPFPRPSTSLQKTEVEIHLLPFERWQEKASEQGAGVVMRYSEWQELFAKAQARQAPQAPVWWALHSLDLQGEMQGDQIKMTLDISISLLRKGWLSIPLPFEGILIEKAEATGISGFLGVRDGQLLFSAVGPATGSLRLTATSAAKKLPAGQALSFRLPPVPLSRLLLRFPPRSEIQSPLQNLQIQRTPQATILQTGLASGQTFSALIRPDEEGSKQSPLFSSAAAITYDLRPDLLWLDASLLLHVRFGQPRSFALQLPPHFQLVDIQAPGLIDFSIDPKTARLTLRIGPMPRDQILPLRMRLVRRQIPTSLTLQNVYALGAYETTATLKVLVDPRLRIRVLRLDQMQRLATPTPSQAQTSLRFRSWSSKARLALGIETIEASFQADHRMEMTLRDRQARLTDRIKIDIRSGSLYNLQGSLPKGWQIYDIRDENDREMRFSVRDDLWHLEFPKRLSQGQEVTFTMTLVSPLTLPSEGAASLSLPLPQITVTQATLQQGSLVISPPTFYQTRLLQLQQIRLESPSQKSGDLAIRAALLRFPYAGQIEITRRRPEIHLLSVSRFQITKDLLQGDIDIFLDITQAGIRDLSLGLTEIGGLAVSFADASSIVQRASRSILAQNRALWNLALTRESAGKVAFTIRVKRRIPTDASSLPLPLLFGKGLASARHLVSVASQPDIALSPQGSKMQSIDPSMLPPPLQKTSAGSPLLTFRSEAAEASLSLSLRRFQPQGTLQAKITNLHLRADVQEDGSLRYLTTIYLQTRSLPFFEIQLPKASELWGILLEGKGIKPLLHEGKLRINLPERSHEYTTFLELRYATPKAPLSALASRLRAQAPTFAFPVQRTSWQIHLPRALLPLDIEEIDSLHTSLAPRPLAGVVPLLVDAFPSSAQGLLWGLLAIWFFFFLLPYLWRFLRFSYQRAKKTTIAVLLGLPLLALLFLSSNATKRSYAPPSYHYSSPSSGSAAPSNPSPIPQLAQSQRYSRFLLRDQAPASPKATRGRPSFLPEAPMQPVAEKVAPASPPPPPPSVVAAPSPGSSAAKEDLQAPSDSPTAAARSVPPSEESPGTDDDRAGTADKEEKRKFRLGGRAGGGRSPQRQQRHFRAQLSQREGKPDSSTLDADKSSNQGPAAHAENRPYKSDPQTSPKDSLFDLKTENKKKEKGKTGKKNDNEPLETDGTEGETKQKPSDILKRPEPSKGSATDGKNGLFNNPKKPKKKAGEKHFGQTEEALRLRDSDARRMSGLRSLSLNDPAIRRWTLYFSQEGAAPVFSVVVWTETSIRFLSLGLVFLGFFLLWFLIALFADRRITFLLAFVVLFGLTSLLLQGSALLFLNAFSTGGLLAFFFSWRLRPFTFLLVTITLVLLVGVSASRAFAETPASKKSAAPCVDPLALPWEGSSLHKPLPKRIPLYAPYQAKAVAGATTLSPETPVFLPLEIVNALREAKILPCPPQGEIPWSLQIRYHLKIQTTDAATLQVKARLELRRPGWHRVPLAFHGLRISETLVDGRPFSLAYDASIGYSALLRGPRNVDIALQASLALDPKQRSLSLHLPETSASSITASIEGGPWKVELPSHDGGFQIQSQGSTTSVSAVLGQKTAFQIRWTPQTPEGSTEEEAASLQTLTHVALLEHLIRLRYRFLFEQSFKPTDRFAFVLPEGLQIESVQGGNLRRWRIEEHQGRRILLVLFETPQQRGQIEISTLRLGSPVQASLTLPFLQPLSVARSVGLIGITVAPSLQWAVLRSPGLEKRTPEAYLSSSEGFAGPVHTAFAFRQQPQIDLSIRPSETTALALQHTLLSIKDDRVLVTSRIAVTPPSSPIFSMQLRLSSDLRLRHIRLHRNVIRHSWIDSSPSKETLLTIELATPASTHQILYIEAETSLSPSSSFSFPSIALLHTKKLQGYLIVAAAKDLELQTDRKVALEDSDIYNVQFSFQTGVFRDPSKKQGRRNRGEPGNPAYTDEAALFLPFLAGVSEARLFFFFERPYQGQVLWRVLKSEIASQGILFAHAQSDHLQVSGEIRITASEPGSRLFRVSMPSSIASQVEWLYPAEASLERSSSQGRVFFLSRSTDLRLSQNFRFRYRIPLSSTHTFNFPKITAEDSVRSDLFLAIKKDHDLRIQIDKADQAGLSEILSSALPRGFSLPLTDLVAAFRVSQEDWRLAFHTQRLQMDVTIQPVVEQFYLYTSILPDRSAWSKATLILRSPSLQFLRFRLPPGSELWKVTRYQTLLKPVRQGEDLLIPLPPRSASDISYPISIEYRHSIPLPTTFATLTLPSPTFQGIAISETYWGVHLPKRFRSISSQGNMDPSSPAQAKLSLLEKQLGFYRQLFSIAQTGALEERQRAIGNLVAGNYRLSWSLEQLARTPIHAEKGRDRLNKAQATFQQLQPMYSTQFEVRRKLEAQQQQTWSRFIQTPAQTASSQESSNLAEDMIPSDVSLFFHTSGGSPSLSLSVLHTPKTIRMAGFFVLGLFLILFGLLLRRR